LARRTERQEIKRGQRGAVQLGDIPVEGHIGPLVAQDGAGVGFDFGVAHALPACRLKAHRHPASTSEQL
jgi:hypothetical protein